jgi:hypothetical protein
MNHIDVEKITLLSGAHTTREEGVCAMELVAWLADEPHSDHPQCTSPVISTFLRTWNDGLNDTERQMLKPYLIKAIGTNTGPEDDLKRAWMLVDWECRVFSPAWLRLAGIDEEARALEAHDELTDIAGLTALQPDLNKARETAGRKADAAWDAAWAAARDAAWDAAWAAARDAARAAARAAAWDAAWAAARAAAWDAAWAAARDAAWAAARDAARDAARAAAWAALEPTKKELQQSALELLDRLCAVGREAKV